MICFFFLHGQVALAVLCLFLWSGSYYCPVFFWFCPEALDSKFVFVGHKAIGALFFLVRWEGPVGSERTKLTNKNENHHHPGRREMENFDCGSLLDVGDCGWV